MAALAYLAPPLSGLIAYVRGRTERTRLHGLQSVVLGVVWPASLYLLSWVSPRATQIGFAAAVLLWLVLLITTVAGADLTLPGTRGALERAAADAPRD